MFNCGVRCITCVRCWFNYSCLFIFTVTVIIILLVLFIFFNFFFVLFYVSFLMFFVSLSFLCFAFPVWRRYDPCQPKYPYLKKKNNLLTNVSFQNKQTEPYAPKYQTFTKHFLFPAFYYIPLRNFAINFFLFVFNY